MILLGIDIGSSFIKVNLFDAEKGQSIAQAFHPPTEMNIVSPHHNWAEQDPESWMTSLKMAIGLLKNNHSHSLKNVGAIGISYQMHGLVAVDKNGVVVRNAIIWCDSRAVEIGNKAFHYLGENFCLKHLLNSPGNFTASKLKWVKDHEPAVYERIYKIMLPGDYIAYRLTNEIKTTASGLSEGIFWDFEKNSVSDELLNHYGLDKNLLPEVADTFSIQGKLTAEMAELLGMKANIPVSYRAGDQPNNALSLKVLNPGEVAATAGTSGVVYGVTDQKKFDTKSRVNTFLHVNNSLMNPRLGILLCLNSVGIMNSWARHQIMGGQINYDEMNKMAAQAPEGSDGLFVLPFGNGAERVLCNRNIGASFHGLNLTSHNQSHLLRALQEGVAFAFQHGVEVMETLGVGLSVIRAGKTNMFLSNLFTQTLANISGAAIELYNTDGSEGAARGAGIGTGFFKSPEEAFDGLKLLETIEPNHHTRIHESYFQWKSLLATTLQADI